MPDRTLTEKIKIGLAVGALLAVVVGMILARLRVYAQKNQAALDYLKNTTIVRLGPLRLNLTQTFCGILSLMGVFATVNYDAYGTHSEAGNYDSYDLLHYYVGAKYFDELGYFRLLPALINADDESNQFCQSTVRRYLYQDEQDYQFKSLDHGLAQKEAVKKHFTDHRWAQFKHDISYLQTADRNLSCKLWRQVLQDHGFNGTPVWVFMARPFVNLVPVEHVKWIASLDLVWLIVMLIAIGWAFGAETAIFAWLFITVCYSFRWPIVTQSLLRYDWLATMVIGICMIKKEKHFAAGAFIGYATLMRYFPGLWLFGIAAKGVHALLTNKTVPWSRPWARIPRRYFQMAAGFFVVVIVLVSASIVRDGVESHRTSLANIAAHVKPHNLSSRRMGFVIATVYRGETDQKLITPEKKKMVAEMEDKVKVFSLIFMLVLGLFMSRMKDFEAVGLGLIPYFLLTTSSYYYYALRLTGVVIHAQDLSKTRNVVGLFLLFGMELFTYAAWMLMDENRYFVISGLCILLTLYAFTMLGFYGHDWYKHHKASKNDNAPKSKSLKKQTA